MDESKFVIPKSHEPIRAEVFEGITLEPVDNTPTVTTTKSTKVVNKKEIADQVQQEANKYAREALKVYVEILRDETASPKDRMAAADRILDRAVGKPQQVATVHGTSQTMTMPMDFLEALKTIKK